MNAWDDWVRGPEVEPSLYAADFSRLGEQIEILLEAGARIFHFDVGDGHFVRRSRSGRSCSSGSRPSSIAPAGGSTAT